MSNHYNREEDLKDRLNTFFQKHLRLPEEDYYSRLDQEGFSELKSVLSDINNIFTVKVTLAFVEWLVTRFKLGEKDRSTIISEVLSTKPNANGYDLEISDPIQVIAEVKCNLPVNHGEVYGAAQRDGIVKDIGSLIHGKSKSTADPQSCLKFMVLLDKKEIRKATSHLVGNMKEHRSRIVFVEQKTRIDPDSSDSKENVHVVFVEFKAQ